MPLAGVHEHPPKQEEKAPMLSKRLSSQRNSPVLSVHCLRLFFLRISTPWRQQQRTLSQGCWWGRGHAVAYIAGVGILSLPLEDTPTCSAALTRMHPVRGGNGRVWLAALDLHCSAPPSSCLLPGRGSSPVSASVQSHCFQIWEKRESHQLCPHVRSDLFHSVRLMPLRTLFKRL